MFGTFLNSGKIIVSDTFAVTDQKFEAIPYAIGERIRWYVRRHGASACPTGDVSLLSPAAIRCRASAR